MKYLVSHQGRELGPLTADEIVTQIRSRELDAIDYAFDEHKQDWVLLTELPEVTAALRPAPKPAAKPGVKSVVPDAVTAAAEVAHAVTEWFVLKGETKFGPFTEREMIGLLQQKVVYRFDFCWHAGLDGWSRVNDVAAFAPGPVRALQARGDQVIIPRQHARASFKTSLILHDDARVWRGSTLLLSRGGLGFSSDSLALMPGQIVRLHCAGSPDLPAFTAVGEVVAKTFVTDGSPVEYGLRFLELSDDARRTIHTKVA